MSAYSQLTQDVKAKQQRFWVKRPDADQLADMNLAAVALDAIEVLTTVPRESIQVNARKGWLHLEGIVNHQQQRTILEDVTRHLPGVRGVVDSITVASAFR
jgi:osmotically-inducible protein OsmY